MMVSPLSLRRHLHTHAALWSAFIILIIFALVLFGTKNPISLDDALRHFVFAEEVRVHGITQTSWSNFLFSGYFTTHHVDPWFLADLSYLPFTLFPDRILGLKAATFVSLCLLFASVLLFVRRYKPSPLISALILFLFFLGCETFSFRLLLGRPFVLVTALMLFTLYSILEKRFLLLTFLLAFSTLFSHLFIFPLGVSFLGALSWFIVRKMPREAMLTALSALSGVILGILLHPQSLGYLAWMRDILFVIPFSKELDLGNEVYSGMGLGDMSVFLLLAVLSVLSFLPSLRGEFHAVLERRPELPLFLALTIFFFCVFLLWSRAIDLFWPMAVLTLLALLTASPGIEEESHTYLKRKKTRFKLTLLHLLCTIIFVTSTTMILRVVTSDRGRALTHFEAVNQIPEGAKVFDVDWQYFPVYLFLRSDLLYARGVDPTLDTQEVRELISRLTTKVTSDTPIFSVAWFKKIRSQWDQKHLALQLSTEADIDTDTWLLDVRRILSPQYLVLHKGDRVKLVEKLRAHDDLTVAAESRSIIVFALDADGMR